VTPRLRAKIEHDFGDSADEVERLIDAVECGAQDCERVLAAVVFVAAGDIARLRAAVDLSRQDWRDVLVGGGLGDGNWPSVLDARLGPAAP
jgi:hypothetical protein